MTKKSLRSTKKRKVDSETPKPPLIIEMSDNDRKVEDDAEHALSEEDGEMFEGPKDVGGFTVLGDFKPTDKKKVERVLPNWLKNPVLIKEARAQKFSSIKYLDQSLVQKLKDNGIENCFPVQWTVMPELLSQCQHGIYAGDRGFRPRDICVSAPTGSGKTLTFALPIIQALQTRVVPHVRALVILPVRDLAIQVFKVFEQYSQGTSLKVVLLAGKREFHLEQASLVKERHHAGSSTKWTSMADVVVATRGRLLDHIQHTKGFDLTHLRYLVIDEADRQMEDVYDEWLSQVEAAAYTPKAGAYGPYSRMRPGPLTVAGSKTGIMHMQKLLFSATLSQNPDKLEQINLFQPLLFTMVAPDTRSVAVVDHKVEDNLSVNESEMQALGIQSVDKFSTPALLKEKFMDCKKSEKPLILFHFLLNLKFQQVLCFTNSVESTHRLYLLAKQMPGLKVAEISSVVHTEKRERVIRKFARGTLQLLICSDMMTRGMDIENVQYAVSYDTPPYIETYIHRVGRTARANKPGIAITLLEGKEMFHFKKMLRDSGRWAKLKRMSVNRQHLEPLIPQFTDALKILPDILKEQKRQLKQS